MTDHIPNMTPFEALTLNLDDLLSEARHWADGTVAKTQEQADAIAAIIDALNEGGKALEAERVKEKRPLDEAIDAIQQRYNVYLAPTKNKSVKGRVPLAIEALNAAKRPFLLALEAEQEAIRQKAREEAEQAAREAAEAARQASASDLAAQEEADAKLKAAEEAQKAAKAAEKVKAHAYGGGRAKGLRSVWRAEITDLSAATKFYWRTNPDAFAQLVQKLADDDARQNRRSAEGVAFREERV